MHYRAIMTDVNNQSVTSNTISYNWLVKPTPPVFQPATQNIVFGTNTYPQNITSLSPIGGDYPYYLTYWETSLNSTVWSSMSSGDNLFSIYPFQGAPDQLFPTLYAWENRMSYPQQIGTVYYRSKTYPTGGIPYECANYLTVYSNVVSVTVSNLTAGTIAFDRNSSTTFSTCIGQIGVILRPESHPSGGTPPYTYRWLSKPQSSNTWVTVPNSNSNVLSTGTITEAMHYKRVTIDAVGTEVTSNIAELNILPKPNAAVLQPATQTVIIGSGALFQNITCATAISGSYSQYLNTWESLNQYGQWDQILSNSYVNVASNPHTTSPYLTASTTSPTTAGQMSIRLTTKPYFYNNVGDNSCFDLLAVYSNTVTVTAAAVTPVNGGGIQYTGSTSICTNTKITTINNNVVATGGNGTFTYEWQQKLASNNVWTTIANSNSETYLPKVNITENTTFRRKVTDGLGAFAYSNEIAITVLASNGTLVGGETEDVDHTCVITYKAKIDSYSAANGGVTPYAYVWQQLQSGTWVDVSTSTTTATNFATASQTAALVTTVGTFRRKVTDYCSTVAYANEAIVRLQTIIPGTVNIVSSTITAGQTPSLITNSAVPTCATNEDYGSGNQVTISSHWQQATDINGIWSTISGANSLTYQPTELTQTTYFKRVSREGFCSMSAASNIITVSVYNGPLTGGTISANSNCVVIGSSIGTINNTASAAGGRFPYTYEWQINETGNWVAINGTNVADFFAGNITENTSFRRKVTDAIGNSIYSNTLDIKVISSILHAGLIARPLVVCPNINDVFLYDNLRACGGLDSLHYQWEINTNNQGWTNIPNANSVNLSIQNLSSDTKFRRKVTDGGCATTLYSNVVNVYMYPEIVGGLVLPIEQTLCSNSTQLPKVISISQNNHYTNGTVSYQWQKFTFTNPIWTNIPNANQATYQPPIANEVVYYRLKVTSTACNAVGYSSESVVYVNNNCTGQKLISKKAKPIKK
jgi:hypothetical protein